MLSSIIVPHMLPMRELHAACLDETSARDSTKRMVLAWVNCCEQATVVCEKSKYSDMHLFGLGLCHVLHTHDPLDVRAYKAAAELGDFHVALTGGVDVHTCSWHELVQLTAALQTTYTQLLTYDRASGYDCKIDVSNYILVLMTRVGGLLATMFLWDSVPAQDKVCLSDYYEHETDGYYIVKPSACVEIMDVLHSLMRLVLTLLHATPVGPASSNPDVSHFHHEASLDDFYNVATARDCVPGSIVAYKNKFAGLFHDVSQVAYYLYPTYTRPVQTPMADILARRAEGINVLPLLMQVLPDVPVFLEHTTFSTKRHAWSWLVWHKYILLCRDDGSTYCAQDVLDLFSYMADDGAGPASVRAVRPRVS